jgi:aminoglycoside adenylyltransferase-like protein/nucleotidyltransferase-like protein
LDASIPPILDEIASGLRETLGDELVGLYLTGSAVTGDFEPGVSDLDLVVVLGRDPAELDLDGLSAVYAKVATAHGDWVDRIEAVHVGRATLAAFRSSRSRLAVISPGEPFHQRPEPASEWIQNWWQLRELGVPIIGPPTDELVPRVTWTEFRAATRRYLAEVARRDFGTGPGGSVAYAVLTACRGCATLATGVPVSKPSGAAWAIATRPADADVVRAALECRRSRGRAGFEDHASRQLAAAFVRDLVAGCLAAP